MNKIIVVLISIVITICFLRLEVLLLQNAQGEMISIINFSDKKNIFFSILTLCSIFACIGTACLAVMSWVFTGKPPIVSILFRIISIYGVMVGVSIITNSDFITIDLRFISDDSKYYEELHDIVMFSKGNPLQLIGISLAIGFLSEFVAAIQSKHNN